MKINTFFSRPRRAFSKIVCGLYEEMERSDENRSLGNWFLARNFLKNLFWPLFVRVDCSQSQDASIKPLCRVCSQKLQLLWPNALSRSFLRSQWVWSPHIGSRGTSLEKFSHRNIGVHHTKQGCFGRLRVRATCCTRNIFKKPCAIGEILIFICFGPVLYEGSMEGV